ncbi:MAG TPA: phosphatidate cytidylyltransferase [Gammaproteobacteria bacterium]|jgi:phosphatidate cytidylyltransferase|nr:phosphatidate cytidylyltransferase [Gammaproteobacteria bacterium]
MLKQRVLTALVLAVGFLVAVFALSAWGFALFLAVVTGLCACEWAGISGVRDTAVRNGYVAGLVALYLVLQPLAVDEDAVRLLALLASAWWVGIAALMYLSPVAPTPASGYSVFYLLAGPATILPGLLCAQFLRHAYGEGSAWLLLLALALVWAMDIGAYFSGKRWGRRKLAPSISPGKSWEGVVGGIAALLCLWAFALLVRTSTEPGAGVLFAAVMLAGGLSVLGDLFESRAKRMSGVKDSGRLLPGHGGILDRLDSAFVALPLFVFFLLWL